MSEKKELEVSAIENGTVIDHLPAEVTFKVVEVLGLYTYSGAITIGSNLSSKTLGHKGIIKVSDKFFTDEEIGRLAVIAPNATLNIIKDYKNGIAARFWQGIAKIFGTDLKKPYDKFGEDKAVEELVQMYHDGVFDYLYYSMFFK